MSSDLLAKKKKTASDAKSSPDGDHRKRRRNRTTQSCLNCHTSKRMCDRKRPACARCTQLGLTGLCVYEVDDPNQRTDAPDENSRLLKRVAELEGVIRELKNKPNPRWMHHGHEGSPNSGEISPTMSTFSDTRSSPPDNGRLSGSLNNTLGIDTGSKGSSPSSRSSPPTTPSPTTPLSCELPPSNTLFSDNSPSPSELDLNSLFSMYPELWGSTNLLNEHSNTHYHGADHRNGNCTCLLEAPSYSALLELSLRLRKAAETLSRSPSHLPGSRCSLNQRIRELDSLATHALCSIDTFSQSKGCSVGMYTNGPSPMLSQTCLSSQTWAPLSSDISPSSGSTGIANCDDMFMSWEPTRRP
ncbi:hypothetical protein K435DRAFT_966302 [Dendrothele bispora CBS 962.96]|uniref:Zn(2)-C6 fungal-type domain-containing protein n=1 Tax=Dendrothele bispora (strain CBS 962.96) TaxID=1314807 RepID=A0A4S8M170_DENBC|nr:hypothetical protein K435DRAFT_966302 [Dendrothele bispora CBS 962.96]